MRPVDPEAQWEAVPSSPEGIRLLQEGELQGIVSDGILLLGQLWKDGRTRQNFQLVLSPTLTFDNYGFIVPINSRESIQVVNPTIASAENTTLWNQRFDTNQGRFSYRKF